MKITKKITREKLDAFLEAYATDKKVLDIGSGGSSYDRFFPNRLTVDIDPKRGPEIIADIQNLPFKDEEFEYILCTEVIEHVPDPKRAIAELHRVCKKGGTLILTTRFVYPIHDAPGDYWRFTKYGMEALFQDWTIKTLQNETETFSTLAALLQRIAYQTEMKYNKISKLFLFLIAWVVNKMNFLIKTEYTDIKRSSEIENMMTTGYYIVVQKK